VTGDPRSRLILGAAEVESRSAKEADMTRALATTVFALVAGADIGKEKEKCFSPAILGSSCRGGSTEPQSSSLWELSCLSHLSERARKIVTQTASSF
jgi:hypothetical protein